MLCGNCERKIDGVEPEEMYRCESCGEFWSEDDLDTIYECSTCGEFARSENDSNKCPQCGKWGSKQAGDVCSDCQEETKACLAVKCPDCSRYTTVEEAKTLQPSGLPPWRNPFRVNDRLILVKPYLAYQGTFSDNKSIFTPFGFDKEKHPDKLPETVEHQSYIEITYVVGKKRILRAEYHTPSNYSPETIAKYQHQPHWGNHGEWSFTVEDLEKYWRKVDYSEWMRFLAEHIACRKCGLVKPKKSYEYGSYSDECVDCVRVKASV